MGLEARFYPKAEKTISETDDGVQVKDARCPEILKSEYANSIWWLATLVEKKDILPTPANPGLNSIFLDAIAPLILLCGSYDQKGNEK